MKEFSRREMQGIILQLQTWSTDEFDFSSWRGNFLFSIANLLEAFLIGLDDEPA